MDISKEVLNKVKIIQDSTDVTLGKFFTKEGLSFFPAFVQRNYEGIPCQVHKIGDNIAIYSEYGINITESLPNIVEEIKKFDNETLIFEAVLEMWKDDRLQECNITSIEEKYCALNFTDILWKDKDIHDLTFKERFRELESIEFPQSVVGSPNLNKSHLNLAPISFVANESELEKALDYFVKYNNEDIQESLRPAFGSPGGKFYMASKFIPMIPEHSTYVETCTGGGSVFFRKKPSAKEVINDFDKDIVFLYRFLKKLSPENISALKRKNWAASKEYFYKLRDLQKAIDKGTKKQTSDIDRFHRITYLKAMSDAGEMKTYDNTETGGSLKLVDRIHKYKDRLKNVTIENMDYRDVIKKYDSKDTFFYIDPPYPKANMSWKWMPKEEEVEACIKSIKGKFLLSYEVTKAFQGFNRKIILQRNKANPGAKQMELSKKELLVSNYPIKASTEYIYESDMKSGINWADIVSENISLYDFSPQKKKQQFETIIKETLQEFPLDDVEFNNAIDFFSKNNMPTAKQIMESIKEEFKAPFEADFVLQHHWWKGKHGIQLESMQHWDLRIDVKGKDITTFILDNNPAEHKESTCHVKIHEDRSLMKKGKAVERINPGESGNSTKDIPSWISMLDSGKVKILNNKETFKEFEFSGKILQGSYIIERETSESNIWTLRCKI